MIENYTSGYNHSEIESYWQKKWEEDGLYHSNIDPRKPKHYALMMLPYPSGDLHAGHSYAYVPPDARARFMRMKGFNVLFPIGFDAFGLPAENAAIQRNIHPREWTFKSIDRMRNQLKRLGAIFDWRREIITATPEYYRWTEWFFLQFYKHDLAYKKLSPVDWCPHCNTTLAREQVVGEDRRCERCETPVIKKNLDQWFFKITNYADELLDFGKIDWPERVRALETNWIGRSDGASVFFRTEAGDPLEVFTTRPDTLWGVTFMVLAPEHPLVKKITTPAQREAVDAYLKQTLRQSDIQRESLDKEKTGIFTGGYAINPVNDEKIPVWIADYVLMTYGTGAIMAVPAHDQRDFEFARKFDLSIRVVIQSEDSASIKPEEMTNAVPALGVMINSGPLSGTPEDHAYNKTLEFIIKKKVGKKAVNYKLRDWLVSRQRYWGSPIPIIYCPTCGTIPVPEDLLPVLLPEDVEWKPTGESPLKLHPTWRFVKCPTCGGDAERETDTLDTFVCSAWYHLRYLSPHYEKGPFDPKEYDYWMPVDTYTGGIEHANMHLIYTRFFQKACRDMGIVKGDENMLKLSNQGMVLGIDSQRKMSKRWGNVIALDDLVQTYGADTLRAYLMFFARWDQGGPWSKTGIEGTNRWIKRLWSLFIEPGKSKQVPANLLRDLRRKLHQTLISVTNDFESFEFNTVISSLMELSNEMIDLKNIGATGSAEWQEAIDIYLKMLAPVAPHISEEIWKRLGKQFSIHTQMWPVADQEIAKQEEIVLVVQINSKIRDRIIVPASISEDAAREKALSSSAIQKFLEGKHPKQVIVVPGRLVNIVL